MPIAEIKRDLRTRSFAISVEAVQKARLNNKAPICLVALKVRTYTTREDEGPHFAHASISIPPGQILDCTIEFK